MITFILVTTVLTTVALSFVLIPLLRYKENHQQRWDVPILTMVVPLFAISIYLLTGNYAAITIHDNPQALWLMGLAEFETSEYNKALEYWLKLQTQLPPESKEAAVLNKIITETKQRIELNTP